MGTRDISISTVRSFTGLADNLKRALQELESNLVNAIRQVALKRVPVPSVRFIAASSQVASFDEVHVVDTAAASRTLLLQAPHQSNAGQTAIIAKSSASNTLTLKPLSGKVNGATTLALTTAKRYVAQSDGQNYWVST